MTLAHLAFAAALLATSAQFARAQEPVKPKLSREELQELKEKKREERARLGDYVKAGTEAMAETINEAGGAMVGTPIGGGGGFGFGSGAGGSIGGMGMPGMGFPSSSGRGASGSGGNAGNNGGEDKGPNVMVCGGDFGGNCVSGEQAMQHYKMMDDMKIAQAQMEMMMEQKRREELAGRPAAAPVNLPLTDLAIGAEIKVSRDIPLPRSQEGVVLRNRQGQGFSDPTGIMAPGLEGTFFSFLVTNGKGEKINHTCILKYLPSQQFRVARQDPKNPWTVSRVSAGRVPGSIQIGLQTNGPVTEIECANGDGSTPTVGDLQQALSQAMTVYSNEGGKPEDIVMDPGTGGGVTVTLAPSQIVARGGASVYTGQMASLWKTDPPAGSGAAPAGGDSQSGGAF